jgi:hypothetical protein
MRLRELAIELKRGWRRKSVIRSNDNSQGRLSYIGTGTTIDNKSGVSDAGPSDGPQRPPRAPLGLMDLPAEIRLKIWHLSAQDPRILQIRPAMNRTLDDLPPAPRGGRSMGLQNPRAGLLNLTQVCFESRQVAKLYVRKALAPEAVAGDDDSPGVWFNPALDTVYLDAKVSMNRSDMFWAVDMSMVQHFAVEWPTVADSERLQTMVMFVRRHMPNLQTFSVFVPAVAPLQHPLAGEPWWAAVCDVSDLVHLPRKYPLYDLRRSSTSFKRWGELLRRLRLELSFDYGPDGTWRKVAQPPTVKGRLLLRRLGHEARYFAASHVGLYPELGPNVVANLVQERRHRRRTTKIRGTSRYIGENDVDSEDDKRQERRRAAEEENVEWTGTATSSWPEIDLASSPAIT